MGQFPHLQVDEEKTLQYVIIKDQVYEEMIIAGRNSVLPRNKGKALTEFKKEVLELAEQSSFKLFFEE